MKSSSNNLKKRVFEYLRTVPIAEMLQLRQSTGLRSKGIFWINIMLALGPATLAVLYMFLIATPMYTTESRFAVRGLDSTGVTTQPSNGGVLSMGGGAGNTITGFVDGYAVRDFLQSREAMKKLSEKLNFAKLVENKAHDPIVRVPRRATEDQLYDAYSSFVRVRYNMLEQIVVLDVRAFSPQDAAQISSALLVVAEEFADKMNQKARADATRVAEKSIREAEQKDIAARVAVMKWRSENKDIDPTLDVTMLTNLITQLEGQLAQAENDLSMIYQAGIRETPRKDTLEQQIQALKEQIDKLRRRMTGKETAASSRIFAYQALQSDLNFAESNLTKMRQVAEQTKINVESQQKFVAVVAEPLKDFRPSYPNRSNWFFGSLAAGLALSFFGSIIIGKLRTYDNF